MKQKHIERTLFTGLAIWFGLIAFWGFSQSVADPNRDLVTRTILHGVVFSVWIVLLILQAGLIASGRTKWHMRLGMISWGIILLMIPIGYYPVVHNISYGTTSLAEGGEDLLKLTLAYGLLLSGVYYRKKPAVHKRLMILGTAPLMTAAIARGLGYSFGIFENYLLIAAMTLLPVFILTGYDFLKAKRMYKINFIGAGLIFLVLFSNPFWSSSFGRQLIGGIIHLQTMEVQSISVIGSALETGWEKDVLLVNTSSDGGLWETDLELLEGELKFRANQDWSLNWGGKTFTSGELIPGGPNIFTQAGDYKVVVNFKKREYRFFKKE